MFEKNQDELRKREEYVLMKKNRYTKKMTKTNVTIEGRSLTYQGPKGKQKIISLENVKIIESDRKTGFKLQTYERIFTFDALHLKVKEEFLQKNCRNSENQICTRTYRRWHWCP